MGIHLLRARVMIYANEKNNLNEVKGKKIRDINILKKHQI